MKYYLCINNSIKETLCTDIFFLLNKYSLRFENCSCQLYFNNYLDFQVRSKMNYINYIPNTNIEYVIYNHYNYKRLIDNDDKKLFEEIILGIINQKKIMINYVNYEIVECNLEKIYEDKLFFIVIECANCFPKGEKYKAINLLEKSLEGKKYSIYTNNEEYFGVKSQDVMKLGVQPSYRYYKQFKVSRCMRVLLELYNQPILNVYKIEYPKNPKIYLQPYYLYSGIISKEETEQIVNDIVSLNDKPIKVFAKGFQTSYDHPSFSDVNDPKYFKNNII